MSRSAGTKPRDAGTRLLKKGRRGLLRMVFSRAGMIALLMLLQLALLALLYVRLRDYFPHFYTLSALFSFVMALFLLNGRHDPSAKLTWIIVIMALPVFGAPLYFYTRSDLGHRLLKERFSLLTRESMTLIEQSPQVLADMAREAPEALGLCRYVGRTGCFPVYAAGSAEYFPLGDLFFPELLRRLEAAEKFIFLEFFIIDEGLMWGRVLEILTRKAAQGVDVRLIYDGTNEFFTLPRSYPRRLGELGIRCKTFSPITPFLSTYYNYRDHRKILVIDGELAFTGGVNLADEYINAVSRFGHWKDSAVMIRGAAVRSFTLMFLQMWNIDQKELSFETELLATAAAEPETGRGFVMPYGDCPLDDERVGEWVYLDLLNRARRYVYIMTPYLILDGEMETAIRFAAERGVDVRLMLPGIPDKRLPYALAKTHYAALLSSGVRIFEYSPGFVHAKSFVCDGREAVVGTINLDYRSLYHHFECAVYFNGTENIAPLHQDFLDTQRLCREVTAESLKRTPFLTRLAGALAKVLAPLL